MKPLIHTLLLLLICTLCNAQVATVLWTPGNNIAAIQAALNNSYTVVKLEPGKVYQAGARPQIPSGKTFDAQGSTLQIMSSFTVDTRPFVTTPIKQTKNIGSISISVTQGSNVISYSGAGTFANGDLLIAYGGIYVTYNGANYKNGYYGGQIISHTSTTLTMQYPAKKSFTATAIKCYKPAVDVTIKNLKVDASLVNGIMGSIGAEYAVRPKILNCIAVGVAGPNGPKRGIRMLHCADGKISNCLAFNGVMGGTADAPGIEVQGPNDTVQYCRVINFATGISNAGRDYLDNAIYLDNEIAHGGSWTGMDAHANTELEAKRNKQWMFNPQNYTLHSNHVRRGGSDIEDNIFYYPDPGNKLLGVYMFEQGFFNNTIKNNTFYYKTVAPTAVYHNTSSLSGAVTGETALNNQVIQLGTIPAAPPPALMFPDGNTPSVDTTIVFTPPVPPSDTCDCGIYDFVRMFGQ